jgi:hypothetical protein
MESVEDRLVREGKHDAFAKAIGKFRKKKRKTRDAQHDLYDTLTNLGLSSEEADEMINLEMQDV